MDLDHEIAERIRALNLKRRQLEVVIEEQIKPRKKAIAELDRQITALATEDPAQ